MEDLNGILTAMTRLVRLKQWLDHVEEGGNASCMGEDEHEDARTKKEWRMLNVDDLPFKEKIPDEVLIWCKATKERFEAWSAKATSSCVR
jgi:hypothetical protein